MPSGDAREGSDTPRRREPKECEEGRTKVPGTFSAQAHREDEKCCMVRAAAGVTPLGLGGDCFLPP